MSTKVPTADMIVITSMIELESLFGPLFDEYFIGENKVVSKSSVVTTADASDKRQQQSDSTSSTSTLATTVTADGNFDVSFKTFLIFKYFKLPEDVVNRNLQVVLDLQHFKSSPCVLTPVRGESLKILNGFDVSLPVTIKPGVSVLMATRKTKTGFICLYLRTVCSEAINPLAPRKGKFHVD
ncbi:hypothetical protein Tco_0837662 [Tanacetum coccineum]